MATEANQPQTPDLPVESVTSDDTGTTQTSYTPAEPAPVKQEQTEERQEAQPWKDERRAEIFARAREKRQAETEPFSGDPNDPAAHYGTRVDQDDLGELEKAALQRRKDYLAEMAGQQPQGQQQGQPPQQQPARKTLNGLDPELLSRTATIIVDGEAREITVEEALRNYQIEEAAKRRLEDAKALLRHSTEFQRVQQPQPGQPRAEYTEPSEQDDPAGYQDDTAQDPGYTSRRPANVKELVEKIQLGTPEEAAQALEEFVSSSVNRAPPVDETTRVLTALEDHNAQQAIRAFADKNPQIATNPALQAEATREIHKGMAEDLLRAGYSMDELRRAAPDAAALTQLHKQARIQGLKGVRRVSELVDAGYQGAISNLRSLVEQAAPRSPANPPVNMQQRQQRKDTLQPQPAARRLSPAMAATVKSRTAEQSRSEAVSRIRQSRGQPT